MRQSRHKSVDTAIGYIEASDAWQNNITEPVFRRETLAVNHLAPEASKCLKSRVFLKMAPQIGDFEASRMREDAIFP